MYHRVQKLDRITREMLRKAPHHCFLFGDNLRGLGFGGQAKEMRGEPNAVGIPTKKTPSMNPSAFFSDDEFDENKAAIDRAFARIPDNGCMVVIPANGIGTGLAMLETKAPRTFAYLQQRLNKLETTGEV